MDLPDPGIEPESPSSQEDSLPAELPGKPGGWGMFVGLQKIVPDTLYRVLSVNVQKVSNTVWKVIEDSTFGGYNSNERVSGVDHTQKNGAMNFYLGP